MKNMTRRPSTILSRAILAAFLLSLPGSHEAFAQVAGRAGAVGAGSGVSASVGSSLGGVASAPGLAAAMTPANFSLSAPAAPGAIALAPAPLAPAALTAAPKAAVAALIPAKGVIAAAALASAEETRPSAIASLSAAAGDSLGAGHGRNSNRSGSRPGDRFDGRPRRTNDDDGPPDVPGFGELTRGYLPTEAPVIAANKIFFPGVKSFGFSIKGADQVALIRKALTASGSHLILTSLGSDSQGFSPAAVLVTLSGINLSDPNNASVEMTPVQIVTITSYKKVDGVPFAQVSYPKITQGDPKRLDDLRLLVQLTLEQLAPLDPSLKSALITEAVGENNVNRLTNLLAQEFPFTPEIKQQLLAEPSTEARLQAVILEMTSYLREKLALAKNSLAGGASASDSLASIETLKVKMQAIGMPAAIQAITTAEYNKLTKMPPGDGATQKVRSYLEWLLDVPWGQRTEDTLDIPQARKILDKDHFGMEKVKERVLEFLALRKKTGSKKGAIIAFTGPPGVGKTSIAAAIAQALGRKFVRLSLGGVHDESVLRGHSRTYEGSLPGMIVRLMKEAGVKNPVMLFDEVDKIKSDGNGKGGDPTAALLEILDPAQNNTFRDRYLDVDYDLSEVLFIVTGNELSNIPEPLRDRMEIIEFNSYTTLEKVEIAKRHVVPQKRAEAGLKSEEATLTDAAIRRVIEGHTLEAGVRGLRKMIEAVMRKISAWTETRDEKVPGVVDAKDIEHYLGAEEFNPRQTAKNDVGVATGLAVNSHGGATLNVEVSVESGSGQLKLRKQFGDDIEDSAKNALKYVRYNAKKYGLEKVDFMKIDIDINITPAGKVDGPSAGGLMVTAILSALTKRSVTQVLAMTGEITMRGDILPIGGLKEKVMAAHRMGYKEVIFPWANLKDVAEIPKEVRDEMILTPVKTYDEIYPRAIVPAPAEGGPVETAQL